MKPLVVFLVGPTASGKSELALKLAKKINGEIISADSMQIYKGMDIGTAKPTPKERRQIRHHLIDIVSTSRTFSVTEFRQKALRAIRAIVRKKKIPIVCGGTGFYVRALKEGISDHPGGNPEIRERLERESLESLYEKLQKIDSQRAAEIQPNDKKRIVRALEIYELSGKTPSEWHRKKGTTLSDLGYRVLIFGILRDRAELYRRIEKRVDTMFKKGLVKEAEKNLKKKISLTASQAVGYKEIFNALRGKISIQNARAQIKLNTRHLAKRQITWFKKEQGIHWLDAKNGHKNLSEIIRIIS